MSLYSAFLPFKVYETFYNDIVKNNDQEDDDSDDDKNCTVERLKTDKIKVKTTFDEIINFSKPYMNSLIEKYKNYQHEGVYSTKTTINLFICFTENSEMILYGVGFDNVKNEFLGRLKFRQNEEIEDKEFSLNLDAFISYNEEEEVEVDDEDVILLFNKPKTDNTINEEVCVVCYANKPNIIYTDCYHLCVCYKCDEEGNFMVAPYAEQE